MIRAAAWTVGLFALGAVIAHFFSGPFVEPMVLLALGTTLFFVSGRLPSSRRAERADPELGEPVADRAAQ